MIEKAAAEAQSWWCSPRPSCRLAGLGGRGPPGRGHRLAPAAARGRWSCSPVTDDRLGAAAGAAGIHLVMGVDEREGHGRTIYNTMLTFDADGRLLDKHRSWSRPMPSGWSGAWATAPT